MRTLLALALALALARALGACAHAKPAPTPATRISRGECEMVFSHVMAVNMGEPEACVMVEGPLPPCELTRAQYTCMMRAKTPDDVLACP